MGDGVKKKGFKMPSSFTVLFLIILVIAALTWIVPGGAYETQENPNTGRIENIPGTYQVAEEQTPQGLWDVAMAPIRGMIGSGGAIEVGLFILVIGGFLGVVAATGAIDAGIGSIVKKNKGREKWLIPILMIIFALGGTTYGMAEETMPFYALLIPVMIVAGFDTIVAIAIVLIGSGVGVLGSTVNPFATGVASQAVGLSPGDGIGWRLLILVLSLVFSIWYVWRYAAKVEKDKRNSIVDDYEADKKNFALTETTTEMTGRQRAVMWLFGLSFVIMVISLIPWDMINDKWTFFVKLHDWLMGIPVLGNVLGSSSIALGEWYFEEITMLFLVMAILIGLVYGMKEGQIVENFLIGAKDLLSVALIVGLARGIQVVMTDGQMTATVLNWGSTLLEGMSPAIFSVLTFIFYIPMSFLIPSTSGLASATMSIMGPLGEMIGVHASVVITAFQSASGIVNLVTPTSAVVMGALAIGRVDYGKWLKFTWPLLAGLFLISAGVIAIAAIV